MASKFPSFAISLASATFSSANSSSRSIFASGSRVIANWIVSPSPSIKYNGLSGVIPGFHVESSGSAMAPGAADWANAGAENIIENTIKITHNLDKFFIT